MQVEVQEAEASLLVLGPLLAGLCALGIGCLLPQSYVRQAILLIPSPNSPSPAQVAALMTLPLVLDPIIATDSEQKG